MSQVGLEPPGLATGDTRSVHPTGILFCKPCACSVFHAHECPLFPVLSRTTARSQWYVSYPKPTDATPLRQETSLIFDISPQFTSVGGLIYEGTSPIDRSFQGQPWPKIASSRLL